MSVMAASSRFVVFAYFSFRLSGSLSVFFTTMRRRPFYSPLKASAMIVLWARFFRMSMSTSVPSSISCFSC